MMTNSAENPSAFWDDSDYFTNPEPLTAAMIQRAEAELGYQLPASYIELLHGKNGGTPRHTRFPTPTATSWAADHVAVSGICGIGGAWGIDSPELGSRFMLHEWGYPAIGVVVGQCPSAGHDAIMLDYRQCAAPGEPQVVHVDVEAEEEPRITFLAESFSLFLAGLVDEAPFAQEQAEEHRLTDLEKVTRGKFSDLLEALCQQATAVGDIRGAIRSISLALTKEKGHFSLHADPLSWLLYDVQFWLYTSAHPVKKASQYLDAYPDIIVFGEEFGTGGYAPGFVEDWLADRQKSLRIEKTSAGLRFTPAYTQALQQQISQYH